MSGRARGGWAARLAAAACALAAAAAACGKGEPPAAPAQGAATAGSAAANPMPAPTIADATTADAATGIDAATAGSAAGSAAAGAAAVIPADAKELITAVVDDWGAVRATLRRFRRAGAGAGWAPVGAPWPGVVGKSGAAWGVGLHGAGAPAGRDGPVKREGDGKSPAGAFALRGSYGYAKAPPAGARLPYVPVDERWQCVDDGESAHYDQILDRTTVDPDWKSAEEMRRKDALYTWVIDVAHNPARSPGAGSCIFLHVWRNERAGTVGCTAMDERRLAALLATLDPSAAFVLLPRAEYAALAPAWALPALEAAAAPPAPR